MTIKFIIVEGEFEPEARDISMYPVGPTNTWCEFILVRFFLEGSLEIYEVLLENLIGFFIENTIGCVHNVG